MKLFDISREFENISQHSKVICNALKILYAYLYIFYACVIKKVLNNISNKMKGEE